MTDFQFNIAKGQAAYLARLPAATDSLIAVPIKAASIETDSTMKDYDDLAALLAGSSDEQTTAGRKTLTTVSVTVDDTNDWVLIDCDDITWASLSSGGDLGAVVVCYSPASGSADSAIVPLFKHGFAVTVDGTDVVATVANLIKLT